MGENTPSPIRNRYEEPRVEKYTKEGYREDSERLKIVRPKKVRTGTLTGDGVAERTVNETLADFPATYGWHVLCALADEYNVKLVED